ncbi:MAG: GNAT family N-acetyltransferase [Cyclobacteriaceae bacterium]
MEKNPDGLEVKLVQSRAQLRQAFAVREKVYIEEQQIDREDEFDEFEPVSRHFIALSGDQAIGAARWRYTDEGVKLERFAVLPEFRKRGIASELVRSVIEDIRKHAGFNGQKLYLNAQLSAMPLYAKFGFLPAGNRFLECDIEHQRMELKLVVPG